MLDDFYSDLNGMVYHLNDKILDQVSKKTFIRYVFLSNPISIEKVLYTKENHGLQRNGNNIAYI